MALSHIPVFCGLYTYYFYVKLIPFIISRVKIFFSLCFIIFFYLQRSITLLPRIKWNFFSISRKPPFLNTVCFETLLFGTIRSSVISLIELSFSTMTNSLIKFSVFGFVRCISWEDRFSCTSLAKRAIWTIRSLCGRYLTL